MTTAEISALPTSATAFRVRKFARDDPFGAKVAHTVVSDALTLLKKPLIRRVSERGRDVMLPTSRSLMRRLSVLFVASMLTANPIFRQRAIREISVVTCFSDWNPSHFLDVAEMAAAVSLGRVWFSDYMTPPECAAVDEALHGFAIRPGRDQFSASEFWTDAEHNWNIVCCSGLILASTAAEGAPEQERRELLELASSAIRSGLSGFRNDGGYVEGPSYWELALRYAVLAHLFQPSIELPDGVFKSWNFSRALTCPSGASVNYGDSTRRPNRSPFLGWLASQSGDTEAADWQRSSPGRPHPFDLLWPGRTVGEAGLGTPATGPVDVTDFEDVGTVLRSSSEALPNAFVFLKKGSNSVNHAHLDLGSVLFECGGQTFLCDLGRESYSKEGYFGADRFSFFRTRTSAHNTVLIGNRDQSENARVRPLFGGRCGDYAVSAIEIEDEGSALRHRRGVVLSGNALWIRDELAPQHKLYAEPGNRAGPAVWRVYTDANVDRHGNVVRLSKQDVCLQCEVVTPSNLQIQLKTPDLSRDRADKNSFKCLEIEMESVSADTAIVVCFRRNSTHTKEELFVSRGIAEWPASKNSGLDR